MKDFFQAICDIIISSWIGLFAFTLIIGGVAWLLPWTAPGIVALLGIYLLVITLIIKEHE